MAEPQTVADGKPRFRRIMLKLSGEALAPAQGSGIDLDALAEIAQEIKEVAGLGVELALVIGAGNILRGSEYEARGMEPLNCGPDGDAGDRDSIALALQNALGAESGLRPGYCRQSRCRPFVSGISAVARYAIWRKGRVVIFAAGTGNPYFTTDTAASLRALEIGAEVILKASHHVDGVYESRSYARPKRKRFDRLTYLEVLQQNLKVMDSSRDYDVHGQSVANHCL